MNDILIVDDERDIRELIGDILQDEGYSTRLAGNSEECMREVTAEQPGLLILDIWFPLYQPFLMNLHDLKFVLPLLSPTILIIDL